PQVSHRYRYLQRRVPIDDNPFVRQPCRGRNKIAPRLPAELSMGCCKSCGLRRRYHGLGADRVDIARDHRPAEQIALVTTLREHEILGIERHRRTWPEIEANRSAGCRLTDEHSADAADPAHPRLGNANSEGGGNRSIDGVPTLFQNPRADL